ncbi:DeoR/GlpR family DNA-binding transcription regulator [Sediminispirochaeta smaragdinae]|jgi:DeoR/GlpR family transcriptional regulator of sugar metabolism|uniref:Transcriptional regulator, DeoR family n=1 Tax=Sediminispirochaeta smaragdinae (strain DSM 11293 / JCM 15392 / SEBR 4228) TaxID=573413 RepID=E1RC78_SEDSS|nr:DeoR/GlpR family DNA-binding transcription regulator [Sediminispirochaeta smaragdinae]ADK79958.1 transcriptional regulator, DeoR family [Sediminispirochaeta smaragdinae DSM 11293]
MKAKSKTDIRRQKIRQMLISNNVVSINEFCQLLKCSESTIRNDLKYLDAKGLITRTYGGAVLNGNTRYNVAMNTRYGMNVAAKEEIADYIVHNVLVDDSIITLDSGTTMVGIAKKILEASLKLTVITTSLAIAEVLNRTANIDLYLTGGRLNHIKEAFIDQSAIEFVSSMCSDLYLFSCDGVDIEKGFTIGDPEEVAIKKAMSQFSKRTICAVDSSKIDQIKLKKIFDINDIEMIITDTAVSEKKIEKLRSAGADIIKATKKTQA